MDSTADVRPGDGVRAARGPAAAPDVPDVSERVREIAAGVTAPEEAFEPALGVILEATGAAAGAICLFDQRQGLLRLAAEEGLSDEGCRRLRNVRRGDLTSWDMPLHGLLNRRAYLIDSAAKNRYVPPLVEPASSVRTIACLPLYAGQTPLGSLIVVSLAPRALAERDIRALEPVVRELERIVQRVRSRAAGFGRPAPATTEAAPAPGATGAGAARGDAAPDAAAESATAGRVGQLEAAVERLKEEVAAAAAREREVRATLDATTAARTADAARAAARAAELAAEIEGLLAQLAGAGASAVRERERAEETERKHEALAAELAASAARERELQIQLEAAVAGPPAAHGGELEEALQRARTAGEAAAAAQAVVDSVRESLARTEGEVARRESAIRTLEHELGVARAAARETGARETALVAEVETLRSECARLAAARTAPAQPPARPEPRAAAAAHPLPTEATGPPRLMVLDDDPSWKALVAGDVSITVVAPGDGVAERLREIAPTRVLVNLAAPSAFQALGTLREAGVSQRFWGCLALPEGTRAVALGMIEPAARPIDPEAVVAALADRVKRGTRVVTVGSDVDALIGLRQALARAGMSVSMAWDVRQAAELITMVKPEVVFVDLGSLRDGPNVVAGLTVVDPVPTLVLVAGGSDPAPSFAALLEDATFASRAKPLDRVVAGALGR